MEKFYNRLFAILGIIGILLTIYQILPEQDKKIDGEWIMISKISEADLKQYIGAEVKWKLYITEKDHYIKGTAEKIAINNENLDYALRTTLEFEGNIKDDKMNLNYIENGKTRKTSGIFVATIKENKFSGYFSQTASNTKGEIKGFKLGE